MGVAEHLLNPEMTIYEKLDAFLISLSIRDSLTILRFVINAMTFFYIVKGS